MKKIHIPVALAALILVTAMHGCATVPSIGPNAGLVSPTITEQVPSMSPTPIAIPSVTATTIPATTATPTVANTLTPTPIPSNTPEAIATVTPSPTGTIAPEETITPSPTVVAGHSIAKLLILAKEPLGQTMYVWGGGWNEEDTGAGIEACTLGVSPSWAEFASKQDSTYSHRQTRHQIHDGLDCSGYIGWLIYNLFETENGKEGYVMKSSTVAQNFSELGFGEYTPRELVTDWQAGDILSMNSHVWMALGMCEDGSVVALHASPPGVILSGTKLPDGSESQAMQLAAHYMKTYYPEWYTRYPDTSRPYSYLTNSNRMRWHDDVLSDAEELRKLTANEVLAWLFGE